MEWLIRKLAPFGVWVPVLAVLRFVVKRLESLKEWIEDVSQEAVVPLPQAPRTSLARSEDTGAFDESAATEAEHSHPVHGKLVSFTAAEHDILDVLQGINAERQQDDEGEAYRRLVQMLLGNEVTADRLIAAQEQLLPQGERLQWINEAINRLHLENRSWR